MTFRISASAYRVHTPVIYMSRTICTFRVYVLSIAGHGSASRGRPRGGGWWGRLWGVRGVLKRTEYWWAGYKSETVFFPTPHPRSYFPVPPAHSSPTRPPLKSIRLSFAALHGAIDRRRLGGGWRGDCCKTPVYWTALCGHPTTAAIFRAVDSCNIIIYWPITRYMVLYYKLSLSLRRWREQRTPYNLYAKQQQQQKIYPPPQYIHTRWPLFMCTVSIYHIRR